jgi:ABC-type Zn uptake system ZnuABC Zn-binding protein ZnuA
LREQQQLDRLGGWLGAMRRHEGAAVVADHDLWPYFATRFGIRVIGWFEPKPGIAPTSSHLQELIGRMQQQSVRVVLSVPYFSPRHAEFVAQKSGARVAAMAHQVGARAGTDDYLAMIDHDLRAILHALEAP